jgi:hypothetical protein
MDFYRSWPLGYQDGFGVRLGNAIEHRAAGAHEHGAGAVGAREVLQVATLAVVEIEIVEVGSEGQRARTGYLCSHRRENVSTFSQPVAPGTTYS